MQKQEALAGFKKLTNGFITLAENHTLKQLPTEVQFQQGKAKTTQNLKRLKAQTLLLKEMV